MKTRRAIIAGTGGLPRLLADAEPEALYVTFEGVDVSVPDGITHLLATFEKLGALFDDLHSAGVTELVFAGGMSRPALNPANFDAKMITLAPDLMAAMGQGDDALLRVVVAMFEAQGFAVIPAHYVVPKLLLPADSLIGPSPDAQDKVDALKGWAMLKTFASLDVSQAIVVAGGQVLGIETIQGTDAMLEYVAKTPPHLRRSKGVLVKGPKPGQDMRIDVPTIGPQTIRRAADAGLGGIYVLAGGVNVLDKAAVIQALSETGLFLTVL